MFDCLAKEFRSESLLGTTARVSRLRYTCLDLRVIFEDSFDNVAAPSGAAQPVVFTYTAAIPGIDTCSAR